MLKIVLCIAVSAVAACLLATAALAGPTLATNGRGDQLVLYQVLEQDSRPLFAGSASASGHFGALRPISPAYGFEHQQAGVDDAGGAVALWKRLELGGSETGETLVAVRRPHGSFGRPVQLSRGNRVEGSTLAVNGRGDALAVWDRYERSIQYSFRPAGGHFRRVRSLGDRNSVSADVALDPDGGALVSWVQFNPHGKSTYRSAYRPAGGSFGKPETLAGGPGDARPSFASSRAGYALLAWREGSAIKAAERPPKGRFGPPFTVVEGVKKSDFIAGLAVGDGGPAAIAYGHAPLQVVTRDSTAQWSAPQPLGSFDEFDSIDVAMNARGDAVVAWPAAGMAVMAARRAAGEPFGAARAIAPARPFGLGDSPRPSASIERSGRATVAWEQWSGAFVSAYARSLTASGPRPRRRLLRARSYVREAPPSACRPGNTRLVTSSRRSVVVAISHGDGKGISYGCLLSRGALVELHFGELFPSIELAGPFVAYASDRCEGSGCDTVVEVMDLRDARSGLDRLVDAYPGSTAEVPAIVLKPDGAVAWVSCSGGGNDGRVSSCVRGSRAVKHVFAWDRRRREPHQVGAGVRIDPRTITVRGSRLTWLQGRSRRAARLR